MRLLRKNGDGSISLTKDLRQDIPPYAILSHTWSENDEDEVKFNDITNARGTQKPGYQKILFCLRQAGKDGLNYCWVDTCCINKDSETELSQSIRSMFRYYQQAAKCYVYLADVVVFDSHPAATRWAFQASRWFTRGWTVQELIAPTSVEFFAQHEEEIGDKKTLVDCINQATGIPPKALEGAPLNKFTFRKRLSWFTNRQTKLEEDMVYATLGLFDVHMPILYGEGLQHARVRLERELQVKREG